MGAKVSQQSVTANQLWKNSGTDKDFNTWITAEKALYDAYASKTTEPLSFVDWEERKIKRQYNVKTIYDVGNSLFFKTKAAIEQKKTDSQVVSDPEVPSDRIIGMPKPLFYTVLAVTTIGIAFSIIYMVKKGKK